MDAQDSRTLILRVPAWAWAILSESLELDAISSAADPELCDQVRRALDALEEDDAETAEAIERDDWEAGHEAYRTLAQVERDAEGAWLRHADRHDPEAQADLDPHDELNRERKDFGAGSRRRAPREDERPRDRMPTGGGA